MTEEKENKSGAGFAQCLARMQECCPQAGTQMKADFSACETMMKSVMGGKDGKVNGEFMKSMMAMCCGGPKKDDTTAPQG
ncbi:MAG: hypothetical protein EG826_17830 [Deltaproteobacteria bacterium]|nr:hypothetical protein [Deltaproteobacteria bacterium]